MTTTQTFFIRGMDCANEARQIRAAIHPIPGIERVEVDFLRCQARVEFDGNVTSTLAIQQAILQAGFRTEIEGTSPSDAAATFWMRARFFVFGSVAMVGGILLTAGPKWLADWPSSFEIGRTMLAVAAILNARHFLPRAIAALRHFHADMNVLVTMAMAGAFLLGDWLEGATVSLLFAIANLLESWSSLRVRTSIERLLDLAPETAERIATTGGAVESIPTAEVRAGDLLLVRPGARIPADGLVETGASFVNQALLTGESVPISATVGTAVLAGATNGEGALHIRATADAVHSRAGRVKQVVAQAQAMRSGTERWVERFSRIYTPLVLLAALFLAIVPSALGYNPREWIYNALVLVLIACPCALVISTPVTIVSAVSALARGGVLLRGGESVERAARVRAVAFDKTGVLTTGQMRVLHALAMPGFDRAQALSAIAAVEQSSEHPLALAIVAFAKESGVCPGNATGYRAIPGRGGTAQVDGAHVWAGSPQLARTHNAWNEDVEAALAGLLSNEGSIVCAGSGQDLWMAFAIGDRPRTGARRALASLRELGISRLLMLSGDHPRRAARIAEMVGLSEVHAGLLPDEKLSALQDVERASGPICMVGDGLNDAPAMAAATFSVACGDRASTVTLESADAIVWDGELRRIPWLIREARRAMGIVQQNVAIAIGSKLLFAVLAAFGVATLWMAVLADVGATLIVTFNGLRMLAAAQTAEMETREALAPSKTSS